MIFANHAHLMPVEINPNGTYDLLVKYMDEVGLDKVVAFAPFDSYLKDIDAPEKNPNLYMHAMIKDNRDIVGFGVVDFTREDLDSQLEEIASLGYKGIKLHPQHQRFSVVGEKAFRVYKKCEELGLFISFHTGIHCDRLINNRVDLFDEVAWNFPRLRFSMEHMGGMCYFLEALAVMVNNKHGGIQPRVFAGWTTIQEGRGIWSISDEQLYTLLVQTGENSHIFGLDFPFNNADHAKRSIARIRGLDIPDSTKEKILGLNLKNALGM